MLTIGSPVIVLLEEWIVDDALASPLLEVKLEDLLLIVRLFTAGLLDDEAFEELLTGQLDVFDEDRDTPSFRTELIEVLLGLVDVEVFAVTVINTVRVINFMGGVNVATAVRLDLIVVV